MLNQKSFAAVIVLVILFCMAGCDGNENPSSPDFSYEKLISKLVEDSDNYTALSYEDSKLFKYEIVAESQVVSSIELNYNDEDMLECEDYLSNIGNLEMSKKYFYNSSAQLDSMAILQDDGSSGSELTGYTKYYYDNKNRLIKSVQYDINDELIFGTEYSYDSDNNITKKTTSDADGVLYIETMTYDDKINPWHVLKNYLFYEGVISENNVLSTSTVYIDSGELLDVTYTYTYDSDGYPQTRITEYNDTQIHFTYEYK